MEDGVSASSCPKVDGLGGSLLEGEVLGTSCPIEGGTGLFGRSVMAVDVLCIDFGLLSKVLLVQFITSML